MLMFEARSWSGGGLRGFDGGWWLFGGGLCSLSSGLRTVGELVGLLDYQMLSSAYEGDLWK